MKKKIIHQVTMSLLALIAIWYAIILYWQLPNYILPTPWQVLHCLYQQIHLIIQQLMFTLFEIIISLLLGIVIGSLAAFIIAFYQPLARWMLPMMIISQAIPIFALAPLFVIWFGYGMSAKIVTGVLMIFFPITSALFDGLKQTDNNWLNLASTMRASKWRSFIIIRIPAALPSLACGIRIATVIAPLGAIVGEWVGASQGLGYLMLNANARMQIDLMFACVTIIMLLSLVLYFSIDHCLKYFIFWQPTDTQNA
jgi:putative hydroxymethylpyrimidine transport system permease protein